MKQQFKTIRYKKKTLELIKAIQNILNELRTKGITEVTVRQVYYQLVAKNLINNNLAQYGLIDRIIKDARYTGEIDWNSIVDNSKIYIEPTTFENIEELIDAAVSSYRLNKWKHQDWYIEVWSEKDAIRSVIEPITREFQIPVFIARGRASSTHLYKAKERFNNTDKKTIILYLGDHDACGLQMIEDIKKRMEEFDSCVTVIPIALTMEQITKWNIPTDQITKEGDTNKKWYEEKTGTNKCWEIDALQPDVLQQILREQILSFLDITKFEEVRNQEQKDVILLKKRIVNQNNK